MSPATPSTRRRSSPRSPDRLPPRPRSAWRRNASATPACIRRGPRRPERAAALRPERAAASLAGDALDERTAGRGLGARQLLLDRVRLLAQGTDDELRRESEQRRDQQPDPVRLEAEHL